jgi:hypothetical protein
MVYVVQKGGIRFAPFLQGQTKETAFDWFLQNSTFTLLTNSSVSCMTFVVFDTEITFFEIIHMYVFDIVYSLSCR